MSDKRTLVIEFSPDRKLEDVIREYTLSALEYHGGNCTKAALALGLGKHAVREKLKAWGLWQQKQIVFRKGERA
jgi:DNA-binding NtrC family response regulator